ncbi:Asparagine--tRNA ligase, cytoplasmic [Takifugu flavidus]|uniref:Asparagine--tRNA ligase, cytoplasmic n=1 Tax=Takifugu flavidus TaxID=433684 RepID=A0A5C6NPL1_9TELE|nr:Asparagine--tRNA ligase, cytoplasmic [Takifugu flavidus]
MALLNFPIPDLAVTLQEVNRVLELILSPELFSDFKNSVKHQREVLLEVQKKFTTLAKDQENWVTEIFKRSLLSCDDPLPTSTALPFVLLPSQAKQRSQLGRAAALLWAAAKLRAEPCLLEGSTSLECTQQSELFAATRIPGRNQDEIKVYPDSTHAIVICGGGVFPIDVMSRPCDGSALSARPFRDIYNQLVGVMDQPRAAKENDPSVICSLSALDRKSWAASREDILEQGEDTAVSLGMMESALLALCLDESNAPPEMAAILDALKLGGGGKGSPGFRYYDKVLNVVVFKDGTAGMLFEHSAVDGMVACLVAHCVYTLSETSELNLVCNTTENMNGPSKENGDTALPAPLMFSFNTLNMQKSGLDAGLPQQVLSFDVISYPDAFSALRGQRGLFDAWINFSLQLSLRETFGESAANRFLIVTPTHMRHYKHGRCDPTYSITVHSRKLVDALASYFGSENTIEYSTDLLHLFHVAFMEHKRLIKNTKKGQGVGPHIATLRQSLPSDNPLKEYLDHFRCPPVYITGTDVMEPVECLVGNVYAPNQLAVGYLWRRDKVCIVLNGNGKFCLSLGKLQKSLKKNLELMMLLAVQDAIAHQMGAQESIFKECQTDKRDGEMTRRQENSKGLGSEVNSDYTLVIHGGAGEDMMLNTKEMKLVEFALEAALTVGKGSVLNKDGKHETEATIVDGNEKRSGQACKEVMAENLDGTCAGIIAVDGKGEPACLKILPLHGLEAKWQPYLSIEEEFHPCSPGYCTSKSGPRWDDEELAEVQIQIRTGLPNSAGELCFDFFGDASCENLFSRIVRGEQQQWRVWEDDQHIAFLTPYPNSPGLTVMVPRKPLSSNIFKLEDDDYKALVLATYKVAKLLENTMKTKNVGLMVEGFEIDYAHVKLIPLLPSPDGSIPTELHSEFHKNYPGYVSSLDGPAADPVEIEKLHSKIMQCRPPHSWKDPESHSMLAINNHWYRNLFQIQNTLFHSTVDYFHTSCQYSYALTPVTSDTISSPLGLGSDSEPVSVNLLGQDVYLADSMQFSLEYFLRFQDNLPGVYYISPSFRGEDPDSTHLNQFYHVECELVGGIEQAIAIAERYLAHLTKSMLKNHSDMILNTAGTLEHVTALLEKLDGKTPLPKVPLDDAISMMPSADCFEWVQDGQPQYGRKLTRKGERFLIKKFGSVVWLTEMDHLGVPFYQAYVEGTGQKKAKAADLLFGLGETLGLGERHLAPETVEAALRQHAVQVKSYKWYINMRQVKPMRTSGWGMGSERYLCWLLQHDDIRDVVIIPRMKGIKYMP